MWPRFTGNEVALRIHRESVQGSQAGPTKVIIMRKQRRRRNRLSESGNNMLGLANPQLHFEIVSNDDVLQNPMLIDRAHQTHCRNVVHIIARWEEPADRSQRSHMQLHGGRRLEK